MQLPKKCIILKKQLRIIEAIQGYEHSLNGKRLPKKYSQEIKKTINIFKMKLSCIAKDLPTPT